jgi:hypothetical protein
VELRSVQDKANGSACGYCSGRRTRRGAPSIKR